jgi:integrase
VARLINRLNPNAVKTLRKAGRHADGGGLYLSISPNGGRRWTFLCRWRGKRTELGFGSARDVTLAKAREMATAARSNLATGTDPREARTAAGAVTAAPTFGESAAALIEALRPSFRNPKHAAQWTMTLLGVTPKGEPAETDYCATLRPIAVDKVTTGDVLAVLLPVWEAVPETAQRLRGRIERVLAAAKAAGHRSGENPARWLDNLADLLPKRSRLTRGHHAAMPYASVPAFMALLRSRRALAAMALDLTVLTAARSGETLGARWIEFELRSVPVTVRDQGREFTVAGPCWTVPPGRMKAGRVHVVPLVPRVVAMLTTLQEARHGDFVFPGHKPGRSLSGMSMEMVLRRMGIDNATVHGFRSSFRDWASEVTAFPHEVVEMALAHAIENKTEAAYRRGVLFDKRRELMDAWATYCGGG